MTKITQKFFVGTIAFCLAFSALVGVVSAQVPTSTGPGNTGGNATGTGNTTGGQTISLPNPLAGTNTFTDLLRKIVDWMITIGAPIATVMIIVGAFQMVFAQGDPKRFEAGKNTILYTVIGYGIILIGWGFVTIIQDVLSL